MGGLHVPSSSGIPITKPHKEAVAGGTALCSEEPLP
jgi:hypothetical protein